jgi:hypothetical protein
MVQSIRAHSSVEIHAGSSPNWSNAHAYPQQRHDARNTAPPARRWYRNSPLWGGDEEKSDAWIRDLAVDQVVIANERQIWAICDLLGNRHEDFSMPIPFQ